MLPTIAIIGRPNVGKSTLFNALTLTRNALVANQPGLTRDRQVGLGRLGDRQYWLVDTGGLSDEGDEMTEKVTEQALLAVKAADSVLFIVDARSGLTPVDEMIAQQLRTLNTPVHLVINKTENLQTTLVTAEFYELGFAHVHAISAAHKQGLSPLISTVLAQLTEFSVEMPLEETQGIKIAIVGRPNVGKSTLVNRILGEERVIAYDEPGTTRDSIAIPFTRDNQTYTLIDTAGIRRKARVKETIEKFSIIKTLQTIETCHVVILLLDAQAGISDQDAHLLGMVIDSGRSLIITVNKWDGLTPVQREQVRNHLQYKLHFVEYAEIHFISAKHGTGVGHLLTAVQTAYQAAHCQIATSTLNQMLENWITAHPPPHVHGRRIKLRYIHQGGENPPLFVIHGNLVEEMPDSYKRYLMNCLRETFQLTGTPIRLVCKQGDNPFANRKNILTPRQQKKRKRLLRHVKK